MYLTASSMKWESISLVTSSRNTCHNPNKLETGFLFVFCLTTVQESSSWTFAYHGFIITPNLTDECSSSFGETCLLLKSKFQKFVPTIWDRVCTVFG